MKILIVKKIKTDIHGTVTLAGRLLKYFNENGHECYLTKYLESSLLDSFGFKDKLLPVNEFNIREYATIYEALSFDAIYCLTADDSIVGFQLKNTFFKKANVLVGIYHPLQFMTPTSFLPNYKEYLHRKLIRSIHPQNLIFMDEACRKTHADYYGVDLKNANIIPLPMNILGKELSPIVKKNKLASVGRVTGFKPYPFGVIKAMHILKQQNIYYEYHIIGEGSEYAKLKKLIITLNMSKDVVLHGTVPYADINNIIKDSYCFIGTGTTVGEAAGIGLPSLIAIDSNENFCYGFLGHAPNNVLGEKGENIELVNYETALYKLHHLSEQEYKQERSDSIKKSSFYSTENVAHLFLNAFKNKNSDNFNVSFAGNLLYILSKIQTKYFIKNGFKFK